MPVSKSRRKAKVRNRRHQVINLNTVREKKVYEVDKVILVQPKGRPRRNDFPQTIEGKAEYKAAVAKFVESNPKVEKRIKRTSIRFKESTNPDLLKLLEDESRIAKIERIKGSKDDPTYVHDDNIVTSYIHVMKSARLTKSITHGSATRNRLHKKRNRVAYLDGRDLLRGHKLSNQSDFNVLKVAA